MYVADKFQLPPLEVNYKTARHTCRDDPRVLHKEISLQNLFQSESQNVNHSLIRGCSQIPSELDLQNPHFLMN